MSSQTTRPADSEEDGTGERLPRLRRLLSPVAAMSGVLLLVAAAKAAGEDRRRAAAYGLAAGALLGVWFRREAGGDGPATTDPEAGGDVSAEARAHREESEVLNQSETNPRGTDDEPDVETETEPDEGDVQFTTEQNEGQETKPHLDGDVEDPRRADNGDDHVEVDLSEAAMADEASEATGPSTEQAYPSMEGTDPEPTSPEAPERDGEGAATNPGPMATGNGDKEDEDVS